MKSNDNSIITAMYIVLFRVHTSICAFLSQTFTANKCVCHAARVSAAAAAVVVYV